MKNDIKEKAASSFLEDSFSFRILLHLCKRSTINFLKQIYNTETLSWLSLTFP